VSLETQQKGFGFEPTENTLARRISRILPFVAVFVFVAGGIAFLIVHVGNSAPAKVIQTPPGKVVDNSKTPPTVPVPKTARYVAGKYIVTAMTRQNLAASWNLTHPSLRKGFTYKQWLSGNIPVQYFPAKAIAGASFNVQWSHPNDVLLNVFIFAKPKSGIQSQTFFIELKPVFSGKTKLWRVSYVAPSTGAKLVPSADGTGGQ
jgi:hypothetical protein